jgi:hypothetical protein
MINPYTVHNFDSRSEHLIVVALLLIFMLGFLGFCAMIGEDLHCEMEGVVC